MNATLRNCLIASTLVANLALAAQEDPTPQLDAPATTAEASDSTVAAPAPAARASKPHVISASGSVIAGPALTLYHGEVQVLDLANVTRIAVGNGSVLRASVVASSQVVLIGESAGSSSLRVWTKSGGQFTYEVAVRSFDTSQILRDVQDLLAGEPGISARQVDGHVLIEGDYTAARTAARLEALMKIYPQIVSTVPAHREPVEVPQERMVYMDVRVVEIEKHRLRQLGVNWAGQITGPSLGLNVAASHNMLKAASGGLFGIATNLASQIDLLEQNNDVWTLAEPTVSCKSGGSAKFTVGGEIPILTPNGLGTTTVTYKEFGIILEFKPVADDKGNVSSSIVAEVSEPDPSLSNVGNNGLVAFRKTRTQTDVSLHDNQTLVISGLLSNVGSKAASGVPGAKDLPVLGNFFKSKRFENDRTELVVLVTPRSIEAQSQISASQVEHADKLEKSVTPTINVINNRLAE